MTNVSAIREAVRHWEESEKKSIAAMLAVASMLSAARDNFSSNRSFSVWLAENKINLNVQDRAALINIGKRKINAADVEQTGCRSPQHVWEKLKPSFSREKDVNTRAPSSAALTVKSEAVESPEKAWRGMPEYKSDDQTPYQTIIVHFANGEDVDAFIELISPKLTGQKITARTRSLWFPAIEVGHAADKRYVNEPAA